MGSLLTPTEEKIALLQTVCAKHLVRVLQFRVAVLVFSLHFAPPEDRRLRRFLLDAFVCRAKKDLVRALMPRLDHGFKAKFFCVDDAAWDRTLSHVISELKGSQDISLAERTAVTRNVDSLTASLWGA